MNRSGEPEREEQHTPPPAAADPASRPQDQPELHGEKQQSVDRKKRDYSDTRIWGFPALDVLQAFFNLGLVLTAIIGSWLIWRQLEIMEQQMTDAKTASADSRQDMERLLRANETLATAARTQAEEARTANMRFERANVKLDAVWSEPPTFVVTPLEMFLNKAMIVHAQIGNDGRATATRVNVLARSEVLYGESVPPTGGEMQRAGCASS